MTKSIIAVSDGIPSEQVQKMKELVGDRFIVQYVEDLSLGDYSNIEIMYGWSSELGQAVLDLPDCRLKWIQSESAGVNHINQQKLVERNCLLSSASGIHGHQMSESILGMIFAYTRQLKTSILNQEKHRWVNPLPTTDLVDKRVMIIGTGKIGQILATILQPFKAKVIGVNRQGHDYPGFDEIIQQKNLLDNLSDCDIIVSLLPETPATVDLYNQTFFNRVKPGVIFINAGRGSAVNELDLIHACQKGQVAFAGLDVTQSEPLPEDSPLWDEENILVVPHLSGSTDQYYHRLWPIFEENLQMYLTEKEINVNKINLDNGY